MSSPIPIGFLKSFIFRLPGHQIARDAVAHPFLGCGPQDFEQELQHPPAALLKHGLDDCTMVHEAGKILARAQLSLQQFLAPRYVNMLTEVPRAQALAMLQRIDFDIALPLVMFLWDAGHWTLLLLQKAPDGLHAHHYDGLRRSPPHELDLLLALFQQHLACQECHLCVDQGVLQKDVYSCGTIALLRLGAHLRVFQHIDAATAELWYQNLHRRQRLHGCGPLTEAAVVQ